MGIFWLVVYILAWGVVHSVMASLEAKAYAGRVFGPIADKYYRLLYNLFAGLTFLPVIVLALLLPDRKLYSVPLPWSGLMVLGELLAVVVLIVGVIQTGAMDFIGLNQVFGPETTRPGKLVTNGLYAYIRHPLYSAGLVLIWLFPIMTVNLLVINIALSVYLVVGALFEERKLSRQFGQAYTHYKAATPMFVPFIERNKLKRDASKR